MRVTADMLRKRLACAPQRVLFERLFPDGVDVTGALCVAHSSRFNWDWAASNLLPPDAQAKYESAAAKAWNKFAGAWGQDWSEYRSAKAAAFGRLAARL